MPEEISSNVASTSLPKTSLAIREIFGYDPVDVLFNFGTAKSAIYYSQLFIPNFLVHDGFVFLDDAQSNITDIFDKAKKDWNKSLETLIESFNWKDVTYIFSRHDVSEEEYKLLAELMACAWRAHLAYRFPERTFVVEVLSPKETGDGYGVGFREVTNEP